MIRHFTAALALALTACSPKPQPAPAKAQAVLAPVVAPAGLYELDNAHTSVTFQVSHLGFSNYTAGFDNAAGKLAFDPANPAAMTVEANIDPASLDLNAPPTGFHAEMVGPAFLDAKAFPAITFKSTKVEPTGSRTARVTGGLTLHGVTRPVTLDATFNGGWAPNAYDGARIGFSARGVFKRSDFGISAGIPAPGTSIGVSDEVRVMIETEFGMPKAS
jgi:polyisoprenoid-binding protein YceI